MEQHTGIRIFQLEIYRQYASVTISRIGIGRGWMKTRRVYLAAALLTMVLGLLSRKYAAQLPSFAAEHAGDALWEAMIYCGVRVLFVRRSRHVASLLSLMFCYAIELSQLYQAHWIVSIRNTLVGGLILGKGFLTADLIRYTAGVAAAYCVDRAVLLLKKEYDKIRLT
jgi:hypothetical protein